jgi:hypothetical protein
LSAARERADGLLAKAAAYAGASGAVAGMSAEMSDVELASAVAGTEAALGETGLLGFDAGLPGSFAELEKWAKRAESGKTRAEAAITRLGELIGIEGYGAEGYGSEGERALAKAEALLAYWEGELAAARAVEEYALDGTSGAEKAAASEERLEEAEAALLAAEAAYEEKVGELEALSAGIEAAGEALEGARELLEEAREAAETARRE